MSKSICVAQSVEEIKFILNKTGKEVIFLPLDLSSQIYCIINKIKFYDPIDYVGKTFHQNTIIQSEKLVNDIKFGDIGSESHKKELKAIIRFRFHSIAFILELIENLKSAGKLEEIIVSGWDKYFNQFSQKNHFISHIITSLIDDIKIKSLNEFKHQDFSQQKEKEVCINYPTFKNSRKNILLTNLGYNFLRIVLSLQKKRTTIIVPVFEKISFFKKIIFNLLGVKFIKFSEIANKQFDQIKMPSINFIYKNKNLSDVLNFRINQEKNNFKKFINISKSIDNFFSNVKIQLVITNFTKGIHGYFVDAAKINDIKSICIPHGTLSKNFNDYDKIYKNTISEAITSPSATIHASQSEIAKNFFDSKKGVFNSIINTGNLTFNNSKIKRKNKKKVLFAVTMKDFESIQLLGVEMYYEFLDNLFFLENISKKNNIKFLVKLHPTNYKNLNDLNKIFKNLEFSKEKIDKALNQVFATISYSSTVIEDSINSNCPVILLDRWNRYKHCDAEENENIKDAPVYYINNEEKLINCIKTISSSNSINFEKYVSSKAIKSNIDDLMNRLI